MEGLLNVRYPPYAGKIKQFQRMNDLKPNFDRDGRTRHSILGWLLSLGSGSTSGAVRRYLLVAICELRLEPINVCLRDDWSETLIDFTYSGGRT